VPVNTMQLGGDWQRKFMLIAAAGPASNLVLATIAAVGLRIIPGGADPTVSSPVLDFLWTAIQLNVILAVFNMLPLPPLDGGNVLSGLLRGPAARAFESIRPYGFIILYGLMFSGMLSRLIFPPARAIVSVLLA
jgi:Zn-dependent protease